MNVLELFTTTSVDDVLKYNPDIDEETYRKFMVLIKTKVPIQSGAFVDIDFVEELFDDPKMNTAKYEVTWFVDQTYSMSFVPYGEIITATVRDNSGQLSDAGKCACIFEEISYHGLEEDSIEMRDTVLDRAEDVFRDKADLSSFKTLDDFITELKEDMSEQERLEFDRSVEMYRTGRLRKNGVLIEGSVVRSLPLYGTD